MKTQKALRLTLLTTCTAVAASLVAAPSMAELNQECLFTGEIVQKQADTPLQIRFTGIDDGENARCRAKRRGARSKVQFKATKEIQALPEGSQVLYRYQELVDGDSAWELISTEAPENKSRRLFSPI
jgi:hypothetical protein|tara:strand:+ start:204 stop:584 length:381 start_codon:yes stop_codon:yes gene_type:complete